MKLCVNYLFGEMSTNWSVKRITRVCNCNDVVAKMYFQPCNTADQVNDLLEAIASLSD
jgi:hypothetical protein